MFGEISTGAADDLVRATEIARSMVVRFGMDAELGQVAYEPERQRMLGPTPDWQPRRYGDDTAVAIDRAVRTLIDGAYRLAGQILETNRGLLERTAQELLARETMDQAVLEGVNAAVDRSAVEPKRLPPPLAAE